MGEKEKDLFSTNQKRIYWLFADMVDEKTPTTFEFTEVGLQATTSGKEIPCVYLLGSAKGKEGTLNGDFCLSVWNLELSNDLKTKYPSWKDIPTGTLLDLKPKGNKFVCEIHPV